MVCPLADVGPHFVTFRNNEIHVPLLIKLVLDFIFSLVHKESKFARFYAWVQLREEGYLQGCH